MYATLQLVSFLLIFFTKNGIFQRKVTFFKLFSSSKFSSLANFLIFYDFSQKSICNYYEATRVLIFMQTTIFDVYVCSDVILITNRKKKCLNNNLEFKSFTTYMKRLRYVRWLYVVYSHLHFFHSIIFHDTITVHCMTLWN